jgi:adenylate cyclase
VKVRDTWLRERIRLYPVPSTDAIAAGEHARRGDRDGAIRVMRTAVNDLFQSGQLVACVVASGILVETLLGRGTEADVAEA